MSRFRLTLEYQGTRYHGWQAQSNSRTVQGELSRAAAEVCRAKVDIQGAGRTDAGVHALGQVAHLDVGGAVRNPRIAWAINELLPHDINVLEARRVHRGFHARHDARGRSYLYQVSRRRTAFGKPFVWWVRDPLDLAAMREAAALLPGLHDFSSFAERRLEEGESTRVKLEEAVVAEAGDLVLVRLRASHFLWRMVRRIVGTLVQAGRGEISPADVGRFLKDRSDYPARHTAPPAGLFLEEVVYPGESFSRPLAPVLEVAGGREP